MTLQKFDEARRKYNDDWPRVATVKLYIDDVIEPHTAALPEPYADRAGTRGELDYPPEEFKQVVDLLGKMKFHVFVHSIGDWEFERRWTGSNTRRNKMARVTGGMG